MDQYVSEMAEQLGEQVLLVEFGSGSSEKSRKLLGALREPIGYVPIDISEEHMLAAAKHLRHSFPNCEVKPIVADFTHDYELPGFPREIKKSVVYFPGSTIGNFESHHVVRLLRRIARVTGPRGGLLIGIDLQKEPQIIHDAYNDSQGITKKFNLNLLHRMNRELGSNFEIGRFGHLAEYNQRQGRIEMFIVSLVDQTVSMAGQAFRFSKGERIFTEYSHKYTIDGFVELASTAGFEMGRHWTDSERKFAVLYLTT